MFYLELKELNLNVSLEHKLLLLSALGSDDPLIFSEFFEICVFPEQSLSESVRKNWSSVSFEHFLVQLLDGFLVEDNLHSRSLTMLNTESSLRVVSQTGHFSLSSDKNSMDEETIAIEIL